MSAPRAGPWRGLAAGTPGPGPATGKRYKDLAASFPSSSHKGSCCLGPGPLPPATPQPGRCWDRAPGSPG